MRMVSNSLLLGKRTWHIVKGRRVEVHNPHANKSADGKLGKTLHSLDATAAWIHFWGLHNGAIIIIMLLVHAVSRSNSKPFV